MIRFCIDLDDLEKNSQNHVLPIKKCSIKSFKEQDRFEIIYSVSILIAL